MQAWIVLNYLVGFIFKMNLETFFDFFKATDK
jgi:hypothetical protein